MLQNNIVHLLNLAENFTGAPWGPQVPPIVRIWPLCLQKGTSVWVDDSKHRSLVINEIMGQKKLEGTKPAPLPTPTPTPTPYPAEWHTAASQHDWFVT